MKKKDYKITIHSEKAAKTFYQLRQKHRHNKAVKELIKMVPKSQLPDILIKGKMINLPKGFQLPCWIEIQAEDLKKIRKDKKFLIYRNAQNVPIEQQNNS